jgi:hypothetical protein
MHQRLRLEVPTTISHNKSMKNKIQHDTRHGGPYDRGSADSYYRRGMNPHYYVGATGFSPLIEEANMTPEEIEAYEDGFMDNERDGDFKDYGWGNQKY